MPEAFDVPVMFAGLITLFVVTCTVGVAAARSNRD
jgi:hypothetical protein